MGKGFAAVALAVVAFIGPASAQTLKVGSKNFTEQFIVAELYGRLARGGGLQGRAQDQPWRDAGGA